MHSNQRARLVLHPIVLIVLLVVAGLAVGFGIVWRGSSRTPSASGVAIVGATSIAGLQISSDHLDFGEVGLDRSVSRQLRLGNSGPEPIALRIEGAESFRVDPRQLTVQPNGSARVMVTASATKPGAIQDQLRLFRDGATKPALVVTLEANASTAGGGTLTVAGSDSESGSEGATDLMAEGGQTGTESIDPADAATGSASNPAGTQPPGSVQISRTMGERSNEAADAGPGSAAMRTTGGTSPTYVAPFGSAARGPRGMADPANELPIGAAAREGEEPVKLPRNNPRDGASELDQNRDGGSNDPSQPAAFIVSDRSSLSLMGTMNRFYPQQIGVYGTESSGSFTLVTGIQFPRIPLAFGQSMVFAQNGAAAGRYDAASGQVTLTITLDATDSNGRTAPFPIAMTTGTVVTRNNNGVLVSVSGQPRVDGSGQLRLVGIGQIPLNYGNQAEQQLVMVEIAAQLGFGSAGQGQ